MYIYIALSVCLSPQVFSLERHPPRTRLTLGAIMKMASVLKAGYWPSSSASVSVFVYRNNLADFFFSRSFFLLLSKI